MPKNFLIVSFNCFAPEQMSWAEITQDSVSKQLSFIKFHISVEVNIKMQTRRKVIQNLTY